jgi:hypothetical protein
VGIGTNNPLGLLHVSVDGSSPNFVVNSTTGNIGLGTANAAWNVKLTTSWNGSGYWGLNLKGTDSAGPYAGQFFGAYIPAEGSFGPYLVFNDNQTGGYRGDIRFGHDSGPGGFSFTTNGLTRAVITKNGNVGIGANSPGAKLEVNGLLGAGQPNLFVVRSNTTDNIIVVNGTTGYTGIGTANPRSVLEVARNSTRTDLYVTGTRTGQYDSAAVAFAASEVPAYWYIGFRGSLATDTGNLDFWYTPNISTGMWANPLALTPNGSVGIGTTTPAAKLDVNGNLTVNGSISFNGSIYSTAWTPVSFIGSWNNQGSGCQNVQYKKVGDLVFIRGTASLNPMITSQMFTLPAGFRPQAVVYFPRTSYNCQWGSVISIDNNGATWFSVGGGGCATTWIGLDGIVFSVD